MNTSAFRVSHFLCMLLAAFSLQTHAAKVGPFFVNQITDAPDADLGDKDCDITANNLHICTLRAAVMQANSIPVDADNPIISIYLKPDVTYELTIAGSTEQNGITGDLDIRRPVYIGLAEPADARASVVASNIDDRVFHIHPNAGGTILSRLDISGGDTTATNTAGSAIYVNADNVSLINLDVHDNIETSITSNAKNLLIYETRIHDTTSAGGAVAINTGSSVSVIRSTIDWNGTDYNVISNGELLLDNSTVSTKPGGGSIALFLGDAASSHIISSTIVSSDDVQAIHFGGNNVTSIENAIIDAPNHSACVFASGEHQFESQYNIFSDSTCKKNGPYDVTNLYDTRPRLSPLGYWGGDTPTHRPQTNSPAIDRTNLQQACTNDFDAGRGSMDQRGRNRDANRTKSVNPYTCDTGAVELETDVIFFSEMEEL